MKSLNKTSAKHFSKNSSTSPNVLNHSIKFKSLPKKIIEKYTLYEQSVQSTEDHFTAFETAYRDWNKKKPTSLREDFCGTFLIASEWVKRNSKNTSLGLDIDPEPLSYGKEFHYNALTPDQQDRISLLQQNVISKTQPKVDVVAACNFSFYFLKEWDVLINYFKNVYQSLAPGGAFFLEMAGGPGFTEKETEKTKHKVEKESLKRFDGFYSKKYIGKKKKSPAFDYIWDQQRYNPINHHGFYAIHFEFPNGKKWKNAFVYDWRVWTIPEVKFALQLAGFDHSTFYYDEEDKDGNETGKYISAQQMNNDWCWLGYVVGFKKKKP